MLESIYYCTPEIFERAEPKEARKNASTTPYADWNVFMEFFPNPPPTGARSPTPTPLQSL